MCLIALFAAPVQKIPPDGGSRSGAGNVGFSTDCQTPEKPAFRANIAANALTDELAAVAERLAEATCKDLDDCQGTRRTLLALIRRMHIAPGHINIALLPEKIAEVLNVEPARISEDLLCIIS